MDSPVKVTVVLRSEYSDKINPIVFMASSQDAIFLTTEWRSRVADSNDNAIRAVTLCSPEGDKSIGVISILLSQVAVIIYEKI